MTLINEFGAFERPNNITITFILRPDPNLMVMTSEVNLREVVDTKLNPTCHQI